MPNRINGEKSQEVALAEGGNFESMFGVGRETINFR